jgi:hypothetical protein
VFLPISVVTIQGATPQPARDLDRAVLVWGRECGVFVDVVSRITVDRPDLLVLSQTDCQVFGHVVSGEEDALFDLGRNTGADVVVYYVQGDTAGFFGCAAHPPDRRGAWVGNVNTEWTFIHELTHVVGRNLHVSDTDNLMFNSTAGITNPPPELTDQQARSILEDPALLCVSSIVLNL